ncbi:MAG TPA: hypothetical protein VD905_17555 [Flavobacteriales bacterium]|nr:hypothetical protein [Flavobacteriales bacterium]
MKRIFTGLLLLNCLQLVAQKHEDLSDYYPDKTYWPLEINLVVHVMQYSHDDARNFTKYDTNDIHELFKLVNQMYNNFEQPTLKVPGVPFYRESKIRFFVKACYFHVDSVGWKIDWFEPKGLEKIISYDAAQNLFVVKGKSLTYYNKKRKEGMHLRYKNGKGMRLTVDTAYIRDGNIWFVPNERPDTTGMESIGYNYIVNNNCSTANFEKYARNIPNAINVFFTHSTTGTIMFGCGPNKNFLNMSNVYKSHTWAAAQLISHEIGHCLGLSHTDSPQFSDLPRGDRFGWLHCDTINVSNNIMGYNICRSYLSPMQIAYVHRSYSTRVDYMNMTRGRIYNPERSFKLDSSLVLERSMLVSGDIHIKRGCTFTITGAVTILPETKIIIEDRATLVIDGGSLSVIDKKQNNNVIFCRKYGSTKKPKKKGTIKLLNNGKIVGLQVA